MSNSPNLELVHPMWLQLSLNQILQTTSTSVTSLCMCSFRRKLLPGNRSSQLRSNSTGMSSKEKDSLANQAGFQQNTSASQRSSAAAKTSVWSNQACPASSTRIAVHNCGLCLGFKMTVELKRNENTRVLVRGVKVCHPCMGVCHCLAFLHFES